VHDDDGVEPGVKAGKAKGELTAETLGKAAGRLVQAAAVGLTDAGSQFGAGAAESDAGFKAFFARGGGSFDVKGVC
jgi:hypothetical protein